MLIFKVTDAFRTLATFIHTLIKSIIYQSFLNIKVRKSPVCRAIFSHKGGGNFFLVKRISRQEYYRELHNSRQVQVLEREINHQFKNIKDVLDATILH